MFWNKHFQCHPTPLPHTQIADSFLPNSYIDEEPAQSFPIIDTAVLPYWELPPEAPAGDAAAAAAASQAVPNMKSEIKVTLCI